ncbi:MAG: porphobilinogen synthase, partial [Pirellulaceae bacterium]|nr:porphobilinogen synthase [Pirellulaceae bacterium]
MDHDHVPPAAGFPTVRMRRLRYNPAVRRLTARTRVLPNQLVLPLFVRPGGGICREISAMPGNYQVSPDVLGQQVAEAAELGLGGVILFGIPETKDSRGSDALSPSGIIAQAIRAAKKAASDMPVITDLCFCEYTDHGQCGVPGEKTGRKDVDNDATLELLAKQAVVHAEAGADMIAPSGMMDGMVGAIRRALDAAGFEH